MHRNNFPQPEIPLRQKIFLIILGLFLFIVLLEMSLRLGGFIFLSLQERRNKEAVYKRGTYQIMCLGESTTAFGGRDSYPRQLEEILNAYDIGIKFSVVNKGLPAVNTSYILAQLEDNLNKYKPDMVITMMGINDSGQHIPYEDSYAAKIIPLFNSLRTYKLTRLLWLHMVTKAKEILKQVYAEQAVSLAKAIKLNPKDDWSYIRLGRIYKEQGNIAQTQACFKKALELNPRNGWAYIGLGWVYKEQRDFIQAEACFKKAIELSPKNAWTYIGLGWVYEDGENFAQAEACFKKAIELNPKNDCAYTGLGRFYKAQKNLTQSEACFKKAVELNSRSDSAYLGLGWLYEESKNLSQSEACFKKAVELNPRNDSAYGSLTLLCAEKGEYEFMQGYAREASRSRLAYYNPKTQHNYQKIKEILDKKGIRLVCVQYPMRNVESLKRLFAGQEGIIFVDNEQVFKEALKEVSYKEYFTDIIGGDFGHCTPKGNRLLAENIANVILKEAFHK